MSAMKVASLIVLLLAMSASIAFAQQEHKEEAKIKREVEVREFRNGEEARGYRWRRPGADFRHFDDGVFVERERFMLDGDTLRFRDFPRAFFFDREGMSDMFAFREGPGALFRDGEMGRLLFQDEELMAMERRSHELAAQAREAEGQERDRLERELDDLLVQLFERKQQRQMEQITRMEERLRELRDEQQQRQARQREIIERRKRQLLGEEDLLRW